MGNGWFIVNCRESNWVGFALIPTIGVSVVSVWFGPTDETSIGVAETSVGAGWASERSGDWQRHCLLLDLELFFVNIHDNFGFTRRERSRFTETNASRADRGQFQDFPSNFQVQLDQC